MELRQPDNAHMELGPKIDSADADSSSGRQDSSHDSYGPSQISGGRWRRERLRPLHKRGDFLHRKGGHAIILGVAEKRVCSDREHIHAERANYEATK